MSTDEPRRALLSPVSKAALCVLCVVLILFVVILLIGFMPGIVNMMAATLILSYLLMGPVFLLDRRMAGLSLNNRRLSPKLSRVLAIVAVYVLFLGLTLFTVFRLAPVLSMEVHEFARDLPVRLSRLTEMLPPEDEPAVHVLQKDAHRVFRSHALASAADFNAASPVIEGNAPVFRRRLLSATYTMAMQRLITGYKDNVSRLGGVLMDVGSATLSGLVYALTTLVLVFYLLLDGRELKDGFVKLMPDRHEPAVDRFLRRLHRQFYSVVKGQIIMSLLSGGLMYVLLSLLQIKYALLLSVFLGVSSIFPVIGPWIGLLPIVGFIAFSRQPLYILQVLLLAGLFHVLKIYWLWPRLISRRYAIHPVLFIVSFVVCLKMVGLLGLLMAFPMASLLSGIGHLIKNNRATSP